MAADEGRILRTVLEELAKEGQMYVPAGISARHVHLCSGDLKILFGENAHLHHFKDLSQPGQFASQEKVALSGPGGKIENVRVLGPVRSRTQVEISLTDAVQLGLRDVPVRLSGDLDNTPGIRIEGPNGAIDLPAGVIAAKRHVHMSRSQAMAYRVHDGQKISLKAAGERSCILENVICRTGDGHELELHLDTDEANALGLKNGDLLEIIKERDVFSPDEGSNPPDMERIASKAAAALTGRREPDAVLCPDILDLVTEDDINRAAREGKSCVYCDRKAIITPAARDRSYALGIEIVKAPDRTGQKPAKCPENEKVLELVTAQDLNIAFRDDKKAVYCSADALITPAARERLEETGIRIIRV